jgi:cytochrome b subunit of formate dehydrogenase
MNMCVHFDITWQMVAYVSVLVVEILRNLSITSRKRKIFSKAQIQNLKKIVIR